jgi:carbonic anhydrase
MQRLIEGVHKFQTEKFGKYKSLFRKLSKNGQNPHTLFITCCDSRVLAELITQSQPGDLFVVKNIGNIVPPANVTGSTNSTAAAIEFAVQNLEVNDIVVCGHSQCGAITALVNGIKNPASVPHLREWLSIAEPVQKTIEANYSQLLHGDQLLDVAAEENVLFSLENLHTYPAVQDRLEKGTLHIHGWFFKIATAELFAYDPTQKQFLPLQKPEVAP